MTADSPVPASPVIATTTSPIGCGSAATEDIWQRTSGSPRGIGLDRDSRQEGVPRR